MVRINLALDFEDRDANTIMTLSDNSAKEYLQYLIVQNIKHADMDNVLEDLKTEVNRRRDRRK